jgi:hypothetical protein
MYSKRWIVDRETLKQARAEDIHYLDSPEHAEYIGVFFANGKSPEAPISELHLIALYSHLKAWKEAPAETTRHRHSDCVLPAILLEELVLRDGAFPGVSCMLLCRSQGGRVSGAY